LVKSSYFVTEGFSYRDYCSIVDFDCTLRLGAIFEEAIET